MTRSLLLTSMIPHSSTMKPNTAICLLLLAITCLLRLTKNARDGVARSRISICTITPALFLSLGTLFEYVSGINFGLDQFFLFVPPDAFGSPPGRMAVGTAICLSLIALSILLLDIVPFVTNWTLLAVAGVAASALINFLLNKGPLLGVPWLKSLAVHTALCLLLLSVAAMAARPARKPVSSLLRFAYRNGGESWTPIILTVIPMLVVLPAVIAMRTGFMDALMTLIGVIFVLLTLQMLGQLRDSQSRRNSS